MPSDNPFSDEPQHDASNPFGSSEFQVDSLTFGPNGEVILPASQRRGMVGHVPVLGWLMVVQGVGEIVFGVLFLVMTAIGPDAVAEVAQSMPTVEDTGMTAEQLKLISMLIYGAVGSGLTILGILTAVSGWRLTRFRNRAFGTFNLATGFITMLLGCYCFPTALAVGIYGLIVLQDGPVKDAFQIGTAGYSAKQIKDIFRELL